MPGDRGGCYAAFKVLKEERLVVLNFGTDLSFVAFSTSDAELQINLFREEIYKAFGSVTSSDPRKLPIRVVPNVRKQIIVSYFSEELQVLVAEPECFLAWAAELEKASYGLLCSVMFNGMG